MPFQDYAKNARMQHFKGENMDKIIIGFDTCGGEEHQFCKWLTEQGYDAEVINSTGQGIGSDKQNRLWDQYCKEN